MQTEVESEKWQAPPMNPYHRLDELKRRLDAYRPLPPEVVRNLHEDTVLRWTYHSNAIEGNTLTLKETKVALEGITVGGKTMREHFEAMNHKEAILLVNDLVSKEVLLSESIIKSIHQLILKNIDEKNAGMYRKNNVLISGARHIPPGTLQLHDQMRDFIQWYESDAQSLHPVERAAHVHCEFVKIHPFVDGNGRTSRLLMNLELMKDGFPPAILRLEQRLAYYESLDEAHVEGHYDSFLTLITICVEQGFEPYWKVLNP